MLLVLEIQAVKFFILYVAAHVSAAKKYTASEGEKKTKKQNTPFLHVWNKTEDIKSTQGAGSLQRPAAAEELQISLRFRVQPQKDYLLPDPNLHRLVKKKKNYNQAVGMVSSNLISSFKKGIWFLVFL